MTVGPFDIEPELGPSEFGGSAGLVQPRVNPLGLEGHTPTASEANAMTVRGGMHWGPGEPFLDELGNEVVPEVQDSIDPVTGEEVPPVI